MFCGQALGGVRNLNVHEYVSMEIMRKFDVPVPKGGMATSVADAEKVYKSIIGDGKDCVIKAMVLTGMFAAVFAPLALLLHLS